VVVVARIERAAGTLILVAPVTHTEPPNETDGLEIPKNVKQRIGLDQKRSWVMVNELNRFIWPGPDIRPAPGSDAPFYDALPDWLFERMRESILEHNSSGKLKVTKRTE
jgi:hypothetical protein